jgi:hypothetical protein
VSHLNRTFIAWFPLTSSRMILIESRIHRLARYYIKKQQVPPTFKYEAATASTLVA